MHETSRWLDDAGIVHAGIGETRGLARAPQYFESAKGRVALVSLASTFRPTTDALPEEGSAPGRPGLSALHLTRTIELPDAAMKALAEIDCAAHAKSCGERPETLDLFDAHYRKGSRFAYDYKMDPEDLAEILKNIRAAKQNADLVIVSIHSHECTTGCDDDDAPRGPGDFLKALAHQAIESGADMFVTTGITIWARSRSMMRRGAVAGRFSTVSAISSGAISRSRCRMTCSRPVPRCWPRPGQIR
ncbi:MAG: CapA family protein [Aliidongia sp.]